MRAADLIRSPQTTEGWRTGELWVLLGITLLATAVRLFRVEHWSMAPAEVVGWQAVSMPLHGPQGFFASAAGSEPLALLGLRWLLDAGVLPFHGEGWLRLPFVFVGVVTVPLLALAASVVLPRRTALFAAGLLAVHPWHVAQSQTVAPPMVALALALLATTAALAAPRRWRRSRIAVCVVAAMLACGSDRGGWTVVPMLVGGWVAGSWAPAHGRHRLLLAAALLAAAALPGALFVLGHWPDPLAPTCDPVPWWPFVRSVALPIVVLALLAPWLCRPAPTMLLVAVLLPLVSLVGAAACGAVIEPLDLFALLPACVLLAAAAAATTAARVRADTPGASAFVGALLVPAALLTWLCVDTTLYASVYQGGRSPWREAGNLALGAGRPAHGIVVGAREGSLSLMYYLRPNHWRDPGQDPHPGIRIDPLDGDLATAIASLLREAATGRVLVVLRRDELEALQRTTGSQSGPLASCLLLRVLPCPRENGDGTLYVFASRPGD